MTTVLPTEGSAAQLRARLSGQVFTRDDPDYEHLRLAWNRIYEHQPAMIVVPGSASDVAIAVKHAAEAGLKVAIQATGHGVVRTADGAMLILTHDLDEVIVDSTAWTARIGAGAKWARVLPLVTPSGLAPLLGSTPDVSAVGYTMGGGMGWLARKFGLSADHVRAIEIVTADGELRRADPETDSDLFWALRGGGAGSLGVVTAMEIDLVSVPSIYAGNLLYPAPLAREVAARYRDWLRSVPEELTSAICLMNFPPTEDVPDELRGRSFVIIRGAFVGSDEDGAELLRHWRDWRTPELDLWSRIPFSEIASVSDDPLDPLPALATTEWFDTIDDRVIDLLTQALFEQDGPSPLLMAEIRHAGGAVARQPVHPNAYGNRDRQHVLEIVAVIPAPDDFEPTESFLSELKGRLSPFRARGAYLNFLEGQEKVERSSEGFEPTDWERLKAIKTHYDPRNIFDHGIAIS